MENQENHFDKIFWFIVGICAFGAILTIFLIVYSSQAVSERIADTALIFWLSTAVSGGIGYLLGSSAPTSKTPGKSGVTTAQINATVTSIPNEEKE